MDICKKWDGQAHVYVGINERKGHGTKDSDVIAVKTIVLDVDREDTRNIGDRETSWVGKETGRGDCPLV